jgi:hypothetical protein
MATDRGMRTRRVRILKYRNVHKCRKSAGCAERPPSPPYFDKPDYTDRDIPYSSATGANSLAQIDIQYLENS